MRVTKRTMRPFFFKNKYSQFSRLSRIANRNFRNFRNSGNYDFRNFVNNPIQFKAHFITLLSVLILNVQNYAMRELESEIELVHQVMHQIAPEKHQWNKDAILNHVKT